MNQLTQIHVLLVLGFVGCSNAAKDCQYTLTCGNPSGGSSGGTAVGGGGTGGVASGGTPAAGGSPSSGGVSSLPCNVTCSGATPICEETTHQCVACAKDTDCPTSAPACSSSHVCVPCTANTHCSGLKPACNTATNTCVACTEDGNCSGATPVCKTTDGDAGAERDAGAATDAGTAPTLNICVECLTSTDCKDLTKPVCDTTANACVGCLASTDCKDASKPQCNTAAKTCVACLSNNDCKTAGASKCDNTANTCLPCTADADCTQMSSKKACLTGVAGQANQCVACTVSNETACIVGTVANSCNPKTNLCTSTPKGSVNLCGACVADSECTNGVGTILARCISMTFGPSAAPHGNYCLAAVSSGCTQPFSYTSVTKVTSVSASGAASTDYCGIIQKLATCEAVRDMIDASDTIRCTNTTTSQPDDTLCGCPRNALGICTSAGQGGLCRAIGTQNRCTIQCGGGSDCPSGYGCISPEPNYYYCG